MLTLPPFGFFWFLLGQEAQLPAWHTPAPEALPEYATIVIRQDVAEALGGQGRQILENEALPAYFPKRRWFASKGETVERLSLAYATKLPGSSDTMLVEVAAKFADRTEHYVLPLSIAWEDDTHGALAQQLALARVRRGRRIGLLTDGFATDDFALGIIKQLIAGATMALPDGELRFVPTSRATDLDIGSTPEIRRFSAEQSNSSLVVADAVVLKIVRRVAPGVHPEGEMTRYLTERGFGNTAALFGEVVRMSSDGVPHTLMLAQAFVRNQGDGWTWTLEFLQRTIEELSLGSQDEADAHDAFESYANFTTALGRRLAELHETLGLETDQPEFKPEPADDEILAGWADSAVEQIDRAMEVLQTRTDWPDDETRELAHGLIARHAALADVARRLSRDGKGAVQTRIHGDFHLGQVLVVQSDAYLIDFEGEPARPMVQRRAKSCGLRDVAGLLRSFDYAAATAATARTATSPHATERRAPLLARWRREAMDSVLASYRATLEASDRPWVPKRAEQPLLELFLMEKAAYEIRYEAANRPTWMRIPLRGLHEIAARVLEPETVA